MNGKSVIIRKKAAVGNSKTFGKVKENCKQLYYIGNGAFCLSGQNNT
jgi:hypothetical protein